MEIHLYKDEESCLLSLLGMRFLTHSLGWLRWSKSFRRWGSCSDYNKI